MNVEQLLNGIEVFDEEENRLHRIKNGLDSKYDPFVYRMMQMKSGEQMVIPPATEAQVNGIRRRMLFHLDEEQYDFSTDGVQKNGVRLKQITIRKYEKNV